MIIWYHFEWISHGFSIWLRSCLIHITSHQRDFEWTDGKIVDGSLQRNIHGEVGQNKYSNKKIREQISHPLWNWLMCIDILSLFYLELRYLFRAIDDMIDERCIFSLKHLQQIRTHYFKRNWNFIGLSKGKQYSACNISQSVMKFVERDAIF